MKSVAKNIIINVLNYSQPLPKIRLRSDAHYLGLNSLVVMSLKRCCTEWLFFQDIWGGSWQPRQQRASSFYKLLFKTNTIKVVNIWIRCSVRI